MNDSGDLPPIGDFEDPSLPLKVIMVFVADGGWHLQSVLLRNGNGHVAYLPPYSEPWSERGSTDDWRYLSERIVEGRGGNGHTYEVEGFAATVDDDIEAVVRDWEVRDGQTWKNGSPIAFLGDNASCWNITGTPSSGSYGIRHG